MEDGSTPGNAAPEFAPIPAEHEKFFTGAARRMRRSLYVLGVTGVVICWLWLGWRWAGGFAAGALLSALNFHWLTSAVSAVSEQAQQGDAEAPAGKPPRRKGIAIRFMLRYALIGAVGYVIFKSSLFSLSAFLLGLFLFVGAILLEIGYEIYSAVRDT